MTEYQKTARARLLDMPNDTPYTVDEVAIVLDLSSRSVERILRSGALKSARVLGGRRIKKAWVFEYLHHSMDEENGSSSRDFSHS